MSSPTLPGSTGSAPTPEVGPAAGAPPFSVGVPTWNEADNLPGLHAALQGQGVEHELIVSDGGSSDGSAEAAARLGCRVLCGERGRGIQLRRGARLARGELLLFLHADTRPGPGALAALARAFEGSSLAAAGMRQRVEHPARFYRWVEHAADRRVRLGWVYGDSGLCVRRALYESVGGFGAEPVFEDLELSARLRRRGRIELVREAELRISPRRWEREGRLRRTLKNWCLTALWMAGVAPDRLARHYPPGG